MGYGWCAVTEWKQCTPELWKAHYRNSAEALIDHRPIMFNDDCPLCGHLMVLHSDSRGCVGCHLESASKDLERWLD